MTGDEPHAHDRDSERRADTHADDANRPRGHEDAPDEPRAVELASPFTMPESASIDVGGALTARAGMFRASMIGGFFDDPVVYVELLQRGRSMLFDLGEVRRFPVRVLNKVEDVFVTHAHFDHFAGLVDLIGTRAHRSNACRIFGPPGLAEQVASMVGAFTWDRLGDERGPDFVVGEVGESTMRVGRVRAPEPEVEWRERRELEGGVVLDEPRFRVRTRLLDHGTPVVAYALEEKQNYKVRSDRLGEDGYRPGPWLGDLKDLRAEEQLEASLELPDGSRRTVRELADELLMVDPGETLVYATDFGDTEANRRKVIELATGGDVFFCESFYASDDVDKAREYHHLTTRATAELAREADVARLVPFHFSARYDDEPERLYAEILEHFPRVEIPATVASRLED